MHIFLKIKCKQRYLYYIYQIAPYIIFKGKILAHNMGTIPGVTARMQYVHVCVCISLFLYVCLCMSVLCVCLCVYVLCDFCLRCLLFQVRMTHVTHAGPRPPHFRQVTILGAPHPRRPSRKTVIAALKIIPGQTHLPTMGVCN